MPDELLCHSCGEGRATLRKEDYMRSIAQIIVPAVVTTTQAAQYLGCHPKTVRGLCQRGEIRAVKLGAEWRIPTEALDEFIGGGQKGGR